MPNFFSFTQGSETSRTARQDDASSPLLGRFRAVPRSASQYHRDLRRSSALGLLSAGSRGSVHVGYGALVAAGLDQDEEEEEEEQRRNTQRRLRGVFWDGEDEAPSFWEKSWRKLEDLWIAPRQGAVRKVVEVWWSRWGVLVVLPAVLALAWCAIPFPQYPLPSDDGHLTDPSNPSRDHRAPGHGEARVGVNFWFFLFVYYGFYNLTALIWITKVFNLYSLNWWPSTLGFPLTITLIAVLSIAVPIPIYFIKETRFLTIHNTAWISWTFVIMAMPVAIAFCILMNNERHLGLRHSLSETQRIFTSSWWTGEPDSTISAREHNRRRLGLSNSSFDPDAPLEVTSSRQAIPRSMRRRWLPSSFVRFLWFVLALSIGLLAYLIGEAYAEIYLRTLPHSNLETLVYVYSWVITVHLLDALTGWILGASEGERVGSYPLSWIFKLYFMLTYQTYVRALYARLRSPQTFILLQAVSSGFLITLTPLTMSQIYYRILVFLGLTGQSYGSYQKLCIRNVFIRSVAENTSMLTFLGSILVLHFGSNKHVYPYFAFDDPNDLYNFRLTFWASSVTWACEIVAQIVLRGLVRWIFGVNVGVEGKLDLAVWPELLPTSVAVMLHVLQNMLFSIIRLHFP